MIRELFSLLYDIIIGAPILSCLSFNRRKNWGTFHATIIFNAFKLRLKLILRCIVYPKIICGHAKECYTDSFKSDIVL